MNRRDFSAPTLLALTTTKTAHAAPEKAASAPLADRIAARLGAIERASLGRLGMHILDTASGASFGHRADERFLVCSMFKLLASALVLQRVDRGEESIDRRIVLGRADLIAHSPVTEKGVGGAGMTRLQAGWPKIGRSATRPARAATTDKAPPPTTSPWSGRPRARPCW